MTSHIKYILYDTSTAKRYISICQVVNAPLLASDVLFMFSSARRRQRAFDSVQGPKLIETGECYNM